MAVKLGTAAVTMYLGDQSVTGYLGSQIVTPTVPGVPQGIQANWTGSATELEWDAPESDGGSEITEYRVYFIEEVDPVLQTGFTIDLEARTATSAINFGGNTLYLAAVNAIGEGALSDGTVVVGA